MPLASPTTLDPVLRRTFSSRIPKTIYIYMKGAPVVTMSLVGSFSKIGTLQGDIPKGFSVKATQFPSRFTKSGRSKGVNPRGMIVQRRATVEQWYSYSFIFELEMRLIEGKKML